MLNSNLRPNKQQEPSEVDLTYSNFPDEQLHLDSLDQIGSLVTNNCDRPTHPTDREYPFTSETIAITEKVNSQSVLERFEESERLLNDENMRLKE